MPKSLCSHSDLMKKLTKEEQKLNRKKHAWIKTTETCSKCLILCCSTEENKATWFCNNMMVSEYMMKVFTFLGKYYIINHIGIQEFYLNKPGFINKLWVLDFPQAYHGYEFRGLQKRPSAFRMRSIHCFCTVNSCNSASYCFYSFYCLHLLNIVRLVVFHSQKHYRRHNSNAFYSQ